MINVFTISWNEEFLMPYFMRHYTQFAKVFVIDDHSTDRTVEIAKEYGAEVLPYPYKKDVPLVEKDHSECFVNYAKKYKSDWAICVDTDEFIYHPNIATALKLHKGIIKPKGYMMISDKPPSGDGQIYDEIQTGVRMKQYDKPVIFQPYLDIEFGDGRHSVISSVKPVSDFKLLHYKYLGRDYYMNRSKLVYPRTDMTDEQREYRLNRGLKWYDDNFPKRVVCTN